MHREYAPTQSRWISPDPAGRGAVDPSNPQTWNLYAYVMNNPLSLVDPSGLEGIGQQYTGGSPTSTCQENETGFCIRVEAKGKLDNSPNAGVPAMGNAGAFFVGSNNRITAQINQLKTMLRNPRVRLGLKGVGNIVSGIGKTFAAAGAGLAAPETGGITIPLAIYTGIGAAGNYAAGGTQLVGAITGHVDEASQGADAVSAVTTVTGAVTLARTGDVSKAANAAAFEGFFSAGVAGGATGNMLGESTVERVGTAIDFTQNVQQAVSPSDNQ